jgi:hypothetical protein
MSKLLSPGIAPMELDMGSNAGGSLLQYVWEAQTAKWWAPPSDYCPVCSESEHWEICSTETFKLGHAHVNHKTSISFVEKPLREGGKPWKPTTKTYMYMRMMRKQTFDPVESPKKRAELNNDLSMNGCQCKLFNDSELIGYSVFSMLGDQSSRPDVCTWRSRFGDAVFGHTNLGYCPEKALGLLD